MKKKTNEYKQETNRKIRLKTKIRIHEFHKTNTPIYRWDGELQTKKRNKWGRSNNKNSWTKKNRRRNQELDEYGNWRNIKRKYS